MTSNHITTAEEATGSEESQESETFEVNITLSKHVYDISRLICQFENDLDWDSYVSDLVKQDALNIKNGDCGIFRDYVIRKLKDEETR